MKELMAEQTASVIFISKFEPKLENGYLRVIVEAEINPDYKPFSLEKIYFVGDE